MSSSSNTLIKQAFDELQLPSPDSHKGDNGKLLIIGGSELFHAASKWSLDVASRLVDMVFYSSVPANNRLIEQAKGQFWNGIVVPRKDLSRYLKEADAVLIGPGMTRSSDTRALTNRLLSQHPHKKWVIDAGALQMVDPELLSPTCIITPHRRELAGLMKRLQGNKKAGLKNGLAKIPARQVAKMSAQQKIPARQVAKMSAQQVSKKLGQSTVLIKGKVDRVGGVDWDLVIEGGHPGMTKGGTGDVLAGLVAGLYATNTARVAAIVASFINKKAGQNLAKQVGPFFNATDLAQAIFSTLWQQLHFLPEPP